MLTDLRLTVAHPHPLSEIHCTNVVVTCSFMLTPLTYIHLFPQVMVVGEVALLCSPSVSEIWTSARSALNLRLLRDFIWDCEVSMRASVSTPAGIRCGHYFG